MFKTRQRGKHNNAWRFLVVKKCRAHICHWVAGQRNTGQTQRALKQAILEKRKDSEMASWIQASALQFATTFGWFKFHKPLVTINFTKLRWRTMEDREISRRFQHTSTHQQLQHLTVPREDTPTGYLYLSKSSFFQLRRRTEKERGRLTSRSSWEFDEWGPYIYNVLGIVLTLLNSESQIQRFVLVFYSFVILFWQGNRKETRMITFGKTYNCLYSL